jgi:hypothetical protein
MSARPCRTQRRYSPRRQLWHSRHDWNTSTATRSPSEGLPATAIAWGAWAQIGRATALAEGAGVAIAPGEGAYAFEALLRHDRAYTGYAPITNAPWLTAFAQHSPFAEAFRATGQNASGTSKLRAELNELPPDEWPTRLRRLISDQVSLLRWAPLNYVPASRPKREYASRPPTSPPFAVWRGCCAKSWRPRKPPDIDASVAKGEVDLDSEEEKTAHEAERQVQEWDFADLLTWLKETVSDHVKEVRLSTRPTESPACLIADAFGMTPALARMYRASGQAVPVGEAHSRTQSESSARHRPATGAQGPR